MLLVRTIFHALLLLTAVVIVDTLTKKIAGVQLVLGLIRTGHFFLFAFSAAAALNRQRLLIPLILTLAILIGYPMTMETLVSILVTTVIGIITGSALRGLITEGTPNAPTPQHGPHPDRRPPTDTHQRPG